MKKPKDIKIWFTAIFIASIMLITPPSGWLRIFYDLYGVVGSIVVFVFLVESAIHFIKRRRANLP